MNPLVQRTREVISSVIYINIASRCKDDMPWNTPVYAVNDDKLTFYWRSWMHSQHSKNIRIYPDIFISIYDSTRMLGQNHQKGVYIKAKAYEMIDEKGIDKALLLFTDKQQTAEEFLGNSVKRLYKAVPEKVWLNDLSESQVTSETTQMRIEVPLSDFR